MYWGYNLYLRRRFLPDKVSDREVSTSKKLPVLYAVKNLQTIFPEFRVLQPLSLRAYKGHSLSAGSRRWTLWSWRTTARPSRLKSGKESLSHSKNELYLLEKRHLTTYLAHILWNRYNGSLLVQQSLITISVFIARADQFNSTRHDQLLIAKLFNKMH